MRQDAWSVRGSGSDGEGGTRYCLFGVGGGGGVAKGGD